MGKKKPKKNQPFTESSAPQPGGGTPGASFHPAERPEEEAVTAAPEVGAVPLGLPFSAEEYEALQQRARHVKLPPHDCAQEDSQAPAGGG